MSVREFSELLEGTTGRPEAVGLRADDVVFGRGITGRDPRTGEPPPGLTGQADNALSAIDTYLRDLGGTLDNVARVSFFLRDPRDITKVNAVWTTRFPRRHDRPAYKFMAGQLGDAEEVRLDFFAVLGQERECLYLPKVAHRNPIPMAVRMGRYLFSSRILPFDPDTGEPGRDGAQQARFTAANADQILEMAQMPWSSVSQGRAFVADPDDDAFVRAEWERRTGMSTRPPLHVTRYRAGALAVLLEILAAADPVVRQEARHVAE